MPFAALDIGSNSVKLLIVEAVDRPEAEAKPIDPPHDRLKPLYDRVRVSRLAEGLQHTGRLRKRAMRRTLRTIQELLAEADVEPGVLDPPLTAIVTAPGRRAANGTEFTALVESELGLDVEIVSAEREAALSMLATRRAFPELDPLIMIDLGGASTELARLGPGSSRDLISIDIGAVRLSEAWLPHDPPRPAEIQRALEICQAHFAPIAERFTPPGPGPLEAVLVSGTATTLASLVQEREVYRSSHLHGAIVEAEDAAELSQRLCSLDMEQRRALKGMDPKRADVIHGGALLVRTLFELLGLGRVHISDRGPRWGLIWEIVERGSVGSV